MSNRSSASPRSLSPSNPPPSTSHSQPSTGSQLPSTSTPSMLHVVRPTLATAPSFSALPAHYTPHSSRFTHDTTAYPSSRVSTPSPTASQYASPSEPMRAFESERGVKRARSEDKEGDDDEHQGSFSGSETSENLEQPVLPAPKKRTRTLMTPDQLTALHRLLSMVSFSGRYMRCRT